MASSDDNDKTQFQPRVPPPSTSEDGGSAPASPAPAGEAKSRKSVDPAQRRKSAKSMTDEDLGSEKPSPKAEGGQDPGRIAPRTLTDEEKKRLLAKKKARELAKRKAALIAKKRAELKRAEEQKQAAEGQPKAAEPEPDDKTRIAPAQRRPAATPTAAPASQSSLEGTSTSASTASAASVATQSLPNQGGAAQPLEEDVPDDKTRIVPRTRNTASTDDRTRIAPRKPVEPVSDSQTSLEPNAESGSSENNPDKTVFAKTKVGVLDSDATKVVDNSGFPEIQEGQPRVTVTQYTEDREELLKGRFVLGDVLGAGGMGMVYKAKDLLKVEAQDKDPYVAIKVLSDEFKSHPEAFIALQRESRKTQRIAHPNIVNVHDFDRDGDTVFMTMEFLDGKPLDKLIRQYKTTGLPEEDAWSILEGISAALVYAHAEKIIHSDFKPGNIFVTEKGVAKVFDFGIARAVAKAEHFEESVDDKTVFDAGNLGALTPAYASLEMLEGDTPDVRDDIYALGCIAYEMFTGNHPFNRVHANEAMRLKMKAKRINNISKAQWKVIESAIAFKREDRVATVQEFWNRISAKTGSKLLISGVTIAIVGLIAALAYQNFIYQAPSGISEDDVRSEIEQQLRLEQYKNSVVALLELPEFTSSWETKLWEDVQALRGILGAADTWLVEQEIKAFEAYVSKVRTYIDAERFALARELIENAKRYMEGKLILELIPQDADAEGEPLVAGEEVLPEAKTETIERPAEEIVASLLQQIDELEALAIQRAKDEAERKRLAEKKKQKVQAQRREVTERNNAFDVARGTVSRQLACRKSMNMRDLDIAISKLRSLDLKRYQKAENEIIEALAGCVVNTGRSFPERAEEFKKRAKKIFPDSAIIANIKIVPKDPCDTALAGLGARGSRAICKDKLKTPTEDLGRGPSLVVIPGKGSLRAFAIGKYEVSIDEFNLFCEKTGKCTAQVTDDGKFPMTDISIAQAKEYIAWVSRVSKRPYRLPRKAEWVYAARANTSKLDSNRNCLLNSRGIRKGGKPVKTTIGQQNPWGLVNHVGNAREWVVNGSSVAAVGGSFETEMDECSVTKVETQSGKPDKLTGFRLLREIDEQ